MMETTSVVDADQTGSTRRTPWSFRLMLRLRSLRTMLMVAMAALPLAAA
jgi:hypothetical protein